MFDTETGEKVKNVRKADLSISHSTISATVDLLYVQYDLVVTDTVVTETILTEQRWNVPMHCILELQRWLKSNGAILVLPDES